jgi:hypothetical protein
MKIQIRRNSRHATDRVDPDFESMQIDSRRFFRNWTLDQIRYALRKHNSFFGTDIKIKCEAVAGCAAHRVAAGVVVRRIQ